MLGLVGVSLNPSGARRPPGPLLRSRSGGGIVALAEWSYPTTPRSRRLTSTVKNALRRFPDPARVHVLLARNGVAAQPDPRGDPYEREIHTTVAGVVQRLPPGQDWSLSYQSKSDP